MQRGEFFISDGRLEIHGSNPKWNNVIYPKTPTMETSEILEA